MSPLRHRMIEDMRIRNMALKTQPPTLSRLPGSPAISADRRNNWDHRDPCLLFHLSQDRHLAARSISSPSPPCGFLHGHTQADLDR